MQYNSLSFVLQGILNTKAIGEKSEGQIIASLLKMGEVALIPFGDNQRYDLVVEKNGHFIKVQCKTGRLKDGVIRFQASSIGYSSEKGKKAKFYRKSYENNVDFFAVYCPENDKCYWVPVEEATKTDALLRLTTLKNGQVKGIRFAKDFEMGI